MKSVSIGELEAKFGPALDVAPWGKCLVIQGAEFDPDWEVYLADAGFKCHFGDLDAHPVTFVQLKKTVAPGKVVYVPPAAAKVVSVEPVLGNLEVKNMGKNGKTGPDWSPAQVDLLLVHWKKLAALPKEKRAAELAKMPEFAGRSAGSILQKAYKVQRNEAPVEVKDNPAPKEDPGKKREYEVLSQAYDTLSKSYVELRVDLETLRAFVEANMSIKYRIEKLDRNLLKHKHAQGSGEAVVPMEASA